MLQRGEKCVWKLLEELRINTFQFLFINFGGMIMALFGFGKKEEKKEGSNEKNLKLTEDNASIKILGSGCSKCNELEKNTVAALEQLGLNTEVEHVTDFGEIAAYGVMSTPALVFGNKVISYGKVLKVPEIVKLLQAI